jgi:hypothetical protein
MFHLGAALTALRLIFAAGAASANTILVCRTVDLAAAPEGLTAPAASVFRDAGRLDDPLAAFGGDRIGLRVETNVPLVIRPLKECGVTPDAHQQRLGSAVRHGDGWKDPDLCRITRSAAGGAAGRGHVQPACQGFGPHTLSNAHRRLGLVREG